MKIFVKRKRKKNWAKGFKKISLLMIYNIFFLNNMIKEKFTRELSTVYLKEIIFYPSYNGFNDKVTCMYYLFIKTDFLL